MDKEIDTAPIIGRVAKDGDPGNICSAVITKEFNDLVGPRFFPGRIVPITDTRTWETHFPNDGVRGEKTIEVFHVPVNRLKRDQFKALIDLIYNEAPSPGYSRIMIQRESLSYGFFHLPADRVEDKDDGTKDVTDGMVGWC